MKPQLIAGIYLTLSAGFSFASAPLGDNPDCKAFQAQPQDMAEVLATLPEGTIDPLRAALRADGFSENIDLILYEMATWRMLAQDPTVNNPTNAGVFGFPKRPALKYFCYGVVTALGQASAEVSLEMITTLRYLVNLPGPRVGVAMVETSGPNRLERQLIYRLIKEIIIKASLHTGKSARRIQEDLVLLTDHPTNRNRRFGAILDDFLRLNVSHYGVFDDASLAAYLRWD